jgi:hypothetical protein
MRAYTQLHALVVERTHIVYNYVFLPSCYYSCAYDVFILLQDRDIAYSR